MQPSFYLLQLHTHSEHTAIKLYYCCHQSWLVPDQGSEYCFSIGARKDQNAEQYWHFKSNRWLKHLFDFQYKYINIYILTRKSEMAWHWDTILIWNPKWLLLLNTQNLLGSLIFHIYWTHRNKIFCIKKTLDTHRIGHLVLGVEFSSKSQSFLVNFNYFMI